MRAETGNKSRFHRNKPSMRLQQRCISLLSVLNSKVLVLVVLVAAAQPRYALPQMPKNPLHSAIFVFGDSSVDSGNNNHLHTDTKSNFPPYGMDFPSHIPTGRFSNGKLVTDLAAMYWGIKETIPAYLDKTVSLEDMMTGVCFASSGSGFDPFTAQLHNVYPLEKQLELFREFTSRLNFSIGKFKTENIIKNAAFLIGTGTNDFLWNYYGRTPYRRQQYSIFAYQNFLLQHVHQFIQKLVVLDARKIFLIGLTPFGCLPVIKSLFFPNVINRQCVESISSVARDFNQMVRDNVTAMQAQLGVKIYFMDVFDSLEHMASNPILYGFEKGNIGCCGTGLIEFGERCNERVGICPDASKYVFFDAVHPTEKGIQSPFKVRTCSRPAGGLVYK